MESPPKGTIRDDLVVSANPIKTQNGDLHSGRESPSVHGDSDYPSLESNRPGVLIHHERLHSGSFPSSEVRTKKPYSDSAGSVVIVGRLGQKRHFSFSVIFVSDGHRTPETRSHF
jgi:hypothetical protein